MGYLVPLASVGVGISGAMYVISAVSMIGSIRCSSGGLFSFGSCSSLSGWLLFPLFGPWVSYGNVDPLRYNTDEARYYLASAIIQSAGLVLGLSLAAIIPAIYNANQRPNSVSASLRLSPVVHPSGFGLEGAF